MVGRSPNGVATPPRPAIRKDGWMRNLWSMALAVGAAGLVVAGTAGAKDIGVKSWEEATEVAAQKEAPILLEFGTEW